MEALQEIDTAGVAPCNQVLQYDHDATRDDAVAELLSREEFLSNAPAHIGGMIKVPPVLKTS
jgi:aspartyl-tRNA(Asn)/glutamyl-tRNA(Gln) amidotransferase subunit C